MTVRRLAWCSPTGSILWELWARHIWHFAGHAAALVLGVLCAWWVHQVGSPIGQAVLKLVATICFLASILDLMNCFGYLETDFRKDQVGYPQRLLLKPVSTIQLVLVPMLFGGAAVVLFFLFWDRLVLQQLYHDIILDRLWLGAVILSFFWWMQALAWSLPLFPGRQLVILLVGVAHALLGMTPLLPGAMSPAWLWLILASTLLSAVLAAWTGVKWMRRGAWEGPSRLAMLWSAVRPARTRVMRKRFGSPFRAQFWLEWQRQGIMLPGISGGIAFAVLPIVILALNGLGENIMVAIGAILFLPLILSGAIGPAIARFDQLQPSGELPLYISVRPMTNGGIVLAKIAMALASSALTWLIMAAAACFWIVLLGQGPLIARSLPGGVGTVLLRWMPVFLLMILLTWKNLTSGIAVGFTGRPWLVIAANIWRPIIGMTLLWLAFLAKTNEDFGAKLLRWLPLCLVVALAVKIALSAAAFVWSLHRRLMTRTDMAWIVAAWLTCGLIMAGSAGAICNELDRQDLWKLIALLGFLIFPLADLAIAPLALAWNRHR